MAYDLKSRFDKISPVASNKTGIQLALDWIRKGTPGGTPMIAPENDGESKPLQNDLGTSPGSEPKKGSVISRLAKAIGLTALAGGIGGGAGVQTAGSIAGMVGNERNERVKLAHEMAKEKDQAEYRKQKQELDLEAIKALRDKRMAAVSGGSSDSVIQDMVGKPYKSRINPAQMFPNPDPMQGQKEDMALLKANEIKARTAKIEAGTEAIKKGKPTRGGSRGGGMKQPKVKSPAGQASDARAEFNMQLPKFLNALVGEADKNQGVSSDKIIDQKIQMAIDSGDDLTASLLDANREKIIKRLEEKRRKIPTVEAEKPRGILSKIGIW